MASTSSGRNALPTGSAVILLVESHEDCRDMYADYLRRCGFTVQTADTTDDGLIRASDADVIVTEIRVPGSFDGVELVGRLRDADKAKQTPIIVLTACAFEPDQQRAQAAGCNVFLPKPCLPEQLVSEISAVIMRTIQDVVHRLRAEYMEMPGLRLKAGQVQRLCGIKQTMCQLVLDSLLESKFLLLKPDGAYVRATDGADHPHPSPVKTFLGNEYRKQSA